MNASIKLLAITALLTAGCHASNQDPLAKMYDVQINPELKKDGSYSGDALIGYDKNRIPIKITWSTGRDASGCLKIIAIQVKRTGGDPTVLVSSVRHTLKPVCEMEFDSDNKTKFQSANIILNFKTNTGSSFDGSVATIQGNGKLISTYK